MLRVNFARPGMVGTAALWCTYGLHFHRLAVAMRAWSASLYLLKLDLEFAA
jgi:hypothetical protein